MFIDNFDPAMDDAHEWISDYERSGINLGWTEPRLKKQLYNFVNDDVKFWIRALELRPLHPENLEMTPRSRLAWAELTWFDVKALFVDHFSTDYSRREKWERMFQEPQIKGQPYYVYVDRKERAGRELGRTESEIIRAICMHLLPEYAQLIGAVRYLSIGDVMTALKFVQEQLVQQARDNAERSEGQNRMQRTIEKLEQQVEHLANQLKGATLMRPTRRGLECYNCGGSNHLSRDCRAPQPAREQFHRRAMEPAAPTQRLSRFPVRGNPIRPALQTNPIRPENNRNRPTGGPLSGPPQRTMVRGRYQNVQLLENTNDIEDVEPVQVVEEVNRLANFSKPEPPIDMDVRILNKVVHGQLDTGATFTCIDYQYYDQNLSSKFELLANDGLVMQAADGRPIGVKGIIKLPIGYDDKFGEAREVTIRAVVLDELATKLLFGRDFMYSASMIVDHESRKIYCGEPRELELMEVKSLITNLGSIQMMEAKITETAHPNVLLKPRIEVKDPLGDDEIEHEGSNYYRDIFHADELTRDCSREHFPFYKSKEVTEEHPYIFKEDLKEVEVSGGVIQVGKSLNEQSITELVGVCLRYPQVFSFKGELGSCNVMEHVIDTGDSKPIHSPPYRNSHVKRLEIQRQIDGWLTSGVIQASSSPWSSPVVLVPKKDGTARMCVDLRKVNAITKRDVYPLPAIESLMASLNKKTHFSSLDLNQGYMQIRMEARSISKTAFITEDGLYEFLKMPFGLTNAPATFQRCMDVVLAGLKWNSCLVYLDDIIVYGEDEESHNANLAKVLAALQKANLTIKPSKCAFCVPELKFLGHVVSKEGIKMDPRKVKAVLDQPPPVDLRGVRGFLGMAAYYRRFIKGFATIAEPINALLKKEVKFQWGADQQRAFDELKERLATQPVLCHYDYTLPIELRTDASGIGLGAVLLHEFPERQKRVIAYASRKLKGAEYNYGITELECLAIVWAVDKFRIYLLGVKFKIITDHLALEWLQTKKEPTARLMRWALKLEPFDYEVVYRSGTLNRDADYLSRYPLNALYPAGRGTQKLADMSDAEDSDYTTDEEVRDTVSDAATLIPTYNDNMIIEAQKNDDRCRDILRNLRGNKNFKLVQKMLVECRSYPGRRMGPRAYIPDSMMDRILYALHDDPTSGHGGVSKTLWRFRQRFYNPTDRKQIKHYVQSCHYCQTKKQRWTNRVGKLHPLNPTLRPFERIGMDTVGPFLPSYNGNRKILVITDYFTRWAIAKPIMQETAVVVAGVLLEEVFMKFGAPDVIISDRGRAFQSNVLRELFDDFRSKHILSSPYHPQTNGLTERFNRTLSVMLSMYVHQKQREWDEFIPYAVFAYNSVVQDSTGFSPYYLLFGIEPRLISEILPTEPEQSLAERMEDLHEARELAIRATIKAQRTQKRHYDKNRRELHFNEGDKVLVFRPRRYTDESTKLRHLWEGPYLILRKYSDLNYLVQKISGKRKTDRVIVHISRMKLYHERNPEQENKTHEEKTYQLKLMHQPSTGLHWVERVLFLAMVCILIQGIQNRIVWSPSSIQIPDGKQNLTMYIQYLLPCHDHKNLYEDKANPHAVEVNAKFESWCKSYTKDVIETSLSKFCPTRLKLKTRIDLAEYYADMLGTVDSENVTSMSSNNQRNVTVRRKRFIVEVLLAMVVVTTMVAGTGYFLSSRANGDTIEAIHREQKALTETQEELMKDLRDFNKEITDITKKLEMAADFRNQAVVAGIVSTFESFRKDMQDITKNWRSKKIHPKLYERFRFQDVCTEKQCPLELQEPISCQYEGFESKLRISLQRTVLRNDVEILTADAFKYYTFELSQPLMVNASQTPSTSETSKFWLNAPKYRKARQCLSEYTGATNVAMKTSHCVSNISPEKPDRTTIPIILEGCLPLHPRYSNWTCKEVDFTDIDKSVQMKVEHNKLLVYCPLQQYQINNDPIADCPISEIIELDIANNMTILRHRERNMNLILSSWRATTMDRFLETKFNIPAAMKLITPLFPHYLKLNTSLEDMKKRLEMVKANNTVLMKSTHRKWSNLVKQHATNWIKWIVFGIGGFTLIIITIGLIIHMHAVKRHNRSSQDVRPTAPEPSPPPTYARKIDPRIYFYREEEKY